jgi:hypothetical protein
VPLHGGTPHTLRVLSFELHDQAWHSLVISAAQLQWFWFCAHQDSNVVQHIGLEVQNDGKVVEPNTDSFAVGNGFTYHIRARDRNESNVWRFRFRRVEDNATVSIRVADRIGFVRDLGFTT